MSDTIYLKTGQFSGRSFNTSKRELKQAADALYSLDDHGALSNSTYTCGGVRRPIFTEDVIVEAISIANQINSLHQKLEAYSNLLQSGPEALRDADAGFKGQYSTAWQRAWYGIFGGFSFPFVDSFSLWGLLFSKRGKKTGGKTTVDTDSKEEPGGNVVGPVEQGAAETARNNKRTIINSETIDDYSDASGNKNAVQRGRIRWVCQWTNYDRNGWKSDKTINPREQCNSASASMALSYMGVDRAPGSIVGDDSMNPAWYGTCYNTWTTESGETIQLENHASLDMNDIKAKTELFLNDGGKGDVSPVLIRYSHPGGGGHWLIIVGDNGDGTYQVIGSGRTSERLTTVTIDENGYIRGDGIIDGGGPIHRYAQYTRVQG